MQYICSYKPAKRSLVLGRQTNKPTIDSPMVMGLDTPVLSARASQEEGREENRLSVTCHLCRSVASRWTSLTLSQQYVHTIVYACTPYVVRNNNSNNVGYPAQSGLRYLRSFGFFHLSVRNGSTHAAPGGVVPCVKTSTAERGTTQQESVQCSNQARSYYCI